MKIPFIKRTVFLSLLLFAFIACTEKQAEKEKKEKVDRLVESGIPEVKVKLLTGEGFRQELLSTGKLYASRSASLSFHVSGELMELHVKNGERVKKGGIVASLESFRLKVARDQAVEALVAAELSLKEHLLSRGFSQQDTTDIPLKTMEVIRSKSGYERARLALLLAQRDLESTVLRAPFDGVVANLNAKEYDRISASYLFCTLLDNNTLEARFTVLENELVSISLGDDVYVSPYSTPGEQVSGKITEINPVVDDNGQVHIRARITNNGKLFDGMNAQVGVFRVLPDMMVVPKTAIVLRTGREVVFTYRDGRSYWNYVKTGQENSMEKVVLNGLQLGDSIIIEGNFNLAHESEVKLVN